MHALFVWFIVQLQASPQELPATPLTWRPEKLRISSVKQFDILVEKNSGQKTDKSQKNYDFRP